MNARLMSVARFWIINLKRLICGMSICFSDKIAMKRKNVRHKISLELLHILARLLSSAPILSHASSKFSSEMI